MNYGIKEIMPFGVKSNDMRSLRGNRRIFESGPHGGPAHLGRLLCGELWNSAFGLYHCGSGDAGTDRFVSRKKCS